jgi:hypothetical protein
MWLASTIHRVPMELIWVTASDEAFFISSNGAVQR